MNKIYTAEDLPNLLAEMGSYFAQCEEDEKVSYFEEIVKSGLFADAIGKVIKREKGKITITTEY